MDLTVAVGWVTLILGAAAIIAGIVIALKYRDQKPPDIPKPAGVSEHGAVIDAIKNTTEFAKALKDLDLSGKLLTVGVLLIAISAITAGLNEVAQAITTAAAK